MRFVAALCIAAVLALGALVHAAQVPALFSGDRPVSLRIRASFDDLFARSSDSSYAVDGSIAYTGADGREVRVGAVSISVRGNTSKQDTECTFPKLKVRFDSGSPSRTSMFAGVETFKIGTHCGEAPGERLTRKFGRLANEKAPLREVFVYRLLDIMGIPALRARPAQITYEDADSRRPPLVRHAMLLEDSSEARQRLSLGSEIPMERFGSAAANLTVADTINLTFAEAMIGNFDWCLRLTPQDTYRCDASKPLWNILAFERDGDRDLPVLHDFDLSGMVTGSHNWFSKVLNVAFSATGSRPEVEVVSQLQRTRTLFARGELDAARRRFLKHRDAAFAALRESDLDARGREIITQYLTAFFDAIATDEAFYRPVTVQKTVAYAEGDGAAPACGRAASVPVGTPVGPLLDRHGDRVRVVLLDALWHWTGPRACGAIRQGAVWITADAIGTAFPP
ncbi:MAG TPA: hypothetical protein VHU82_15865 [Vicinamibacterales bacterium]|nr:hypothetical protein [Vicinamibacterales bacterium]